MLCLHRLHFRRAKRKQIEEHTFVRKRTLNKLNITLKYVKTQPDSRLYALQQIKIGEWEGVAVSQSTALLACYKKTDNRAYICSKK